MTTTCPGAWAELVGGLTPGEARSLAHPPSSLAAGHTHFLWLSVRVMPWADTLKCTTVDKGGGSWTRVMLRAFWMAWWPVRDSISTEFRYHTLQAGRHRGKRR